LARALNGDVGGRGYAKLGDFPRFLRQQDNESSVVDAYLLARTQLDG
jgi:hypothetical protein